MKQPQVMFGQGFIKQVNEAKYGEKARETISGKMKAMKSEDKPQKQKIAIAISTAKQKGQKVPPKP